MKYKVSFEEFENLGPISQLRVDWQTGDILVFKGRNGIGKTTATANLGRLLQNQSLPEPLKKGTEKGYYKCVLTDENGENTEILHKFDTSGQTLTVIAPSGHALGKSAQDTLLRRLAPDKRSFYIPDYLEVTAPQKRMEMILKLLPVDAANVIAEDSKKLKEVREKRQKAFQDVALQKGKAVVFDEALAEKEAISAADLAAQKGVIESHNATFERAKGKIADHEAAASDWKLRADRTRQQIEELQKVLLEQIEKENEALELVRRGHEWVANPANTPKSTDEIDAQLQNLNIENQKIADARRVKAEHITLKTYQAVWEGLNTVCRDAEVALRAKMTEAALPVGLGIEMDEDAILSLTLGGVPLEQSSSSERTIAQLHLSLLSMGDLGFVRFDGTLVDDGNMADVMAWLKKHNYQAAIEIMERSGEKVVTYEVADSYFKIDDEPATETPTLFN